MGREGANGARADADSGIELWPPRTETCNKHYSQPGLEAVDYSNLEVVAPPPNRHRPWVKDGGLPQVVTPDGNGVKPDYVYSTSQDGWGGGGGGSPSTDGYFRRDAICGVKRQTFWIFIAIGVFVMVAAVAIGVGLGVALHRSDDPSATPLPSANTSAPVPLPQPTATGGATGPELTILCPANNVTLYSAAGTNRSYLVLCGRDYSSADGATDLFNDPMDSMSDCVDECARQQGCVGVGWGPYNNRNTCWLKSRLGTPNITPNWYFAVEDERAEKKT